MKYENIKAEKKEATSEVEMSGEIPVLTLEEYRVRTLKDISETLDIPGFRKGHIPEKVIVERLGEVYIWEETASAVIKDIAPEIIEKNAPDYIGRPKIAFTKLAPGNPVSFKITISVTPDFKLPDYKKIAKDEMAKPEEKVEVTDKEVDAVIEEIKKQYAHQAFHAAQKDEQKTGTHDHNEKEVEKHAPEFNDEFVKTLGNFTDVADFRAKAKENIQKEKERKNLENRRDALLGKLVAETTIPVPELLINDEISKMYSQFEGDVTSMGLKLDDYLKHIKKTPEDIKKDWLPDAEKRAKMNLILEKIAKEEKITADPEMVEHETKSLTEIHKDIDPLRVKMYVEHTLTVEKVIKFLEEK